MNEFYASLQVGDMVIFATISSKSVAKVVRVTKTQLTLSNGSRFSRNTGRRIGSPSRWDITYLEEATPEMVERVRFGNERAGLVYKLGRYDWNKMSLEELRRINEALPQDKEKGS